MKRIILTVVLLWMGITGMVGPPVALGSQVYRIPIHDTIDGGLAAFVERAVKEAEQAGADAIIFEVNTLGGRLDSAVQIRDVILNSPVKTIAFINKRAISAGALISLSADQIVMAGGSSIGAATAVNLEGKKASEKVISYFRTEMRATAEKTGRPPEIVEAMVDEEIEIPGLSPKGKLLTLTTDEALQHGIAEHKAETLEEILEINDLKGATVVEVKVNWAEQLVRFLTNPFVSSLLLTLGFLGLIVEVRTPGWGVGGTVGIIALALFFGSHYIVRLAGWGELLLFALGALLLLVEILYIPGFGVVGLLGIVVMVASLFMSLIGRFPTSEDIGEALMMVSLSIIGTFIASIMILRTLPKVGAWNRLILHTEERVEKGFRASPVEYESMVGASGVALTVLRPAGTGLFDGKKVTVVSEGEYIPKGARIHVVAVEGNRVVVGEA